MYIYMYIYVYDIPVHISVCGNVCVVPLTV